MADNPVAWAYTPGGDYSEQLDWLTDVIRTPSGNTQHRRLRQSPRITVAFDALETGASRRRMEALLRDNAAGVWWVPVWVDAVQVDAPVAAGATAIPVATSGARFADAGHVLLWDAVANTGAVAAIATGGIGPASITLAVGLAAALPAWVAVVPVRAGRLSEFPQVGRFTASASDAINLQFQLREPLEDAATIAGDLYRGFPVWPFRPDWGTQPAWVPERVLQTIDDDIGPPVVYDMAAVPQGKTTLGYAMAGSDAVHAFRSALFALAGRWSPVWIASYNSDLRVIADVAAGASAIDVEWPTLSGLDLADNQRDIRIELLNGSVLYRRITGITTPAGGVERLALDAPIAVGFSAGDVLLVSMMALCVQDADTNLLRYWARDFVECTLMWRQIAHGL